MKIKQINRPYKRFWAMFLVVYMSVALCAAEDVSIIILHTTDLHGRITGSVPSQVSDNKEVGGLARCATMIKNIREKEANVILIDCGDLIQGTAMSFLNRGKIVMEVVKIIGYDALVPGNHEFDWGAENLSRLYEMFNVPALVANCSFRDGLVMTPLPNSQPYFIKEIAGFKIALIGLTTPNIPNWFRPRLLGDFVFQRSVPALRRVMPRVREHNPDLIILAAHQGHREWGGDTSANEINDIARAFPDIDVIIGGHTHQAVVMREVYGLPYTQAGCYGEWLGKITVVMDGEKRSLKSLKFDLLAVDHSVRPDADLLERFEKNLTETSQYLNQKIGVAGCRHTSDFVFPGQSQVQTLISKAIVEAVKADVALHRALSSYSVRRGSIFMRDVWGIVPYENYIGVALLTAEDLAEILAENSAFLDSREFRGVYGLEYELHIEDNGKSEVRGIRLANGRVLKKGERVKVAINSYDMASAGGRLVRLREIIERPESQLKEFDVDTRDAVVSYIKSRNVLCEEVQRGVILVRNERVE